MPTRLDREREALRALRRAEDQALDTARRAVVVLYGPTGPCSPETCAAVEALKIALAGVDGAKAALRAVEHELEPPVSLA